MIVNWNHVYPIQTKNKKRPLADKLAENTYILSTISLIHTIKTNM